MEASIVDFHQKLYIPAIQKLVLQCPHAHILVTHHCENLCQEAFKSCKFYHNVLWHWDYAECVVDSFAHQIQSEYYSGDICVSIEGIVL